MKIVFLVHRYWPSVGGVEKYVHCLGRALAGMGHELDVVAGATQEGLAGQEMHEGIRIQRFPALRSPLRCRWWFLRKRPLFTRADVIHVSNTHMLEYYWRMIGFVVDRRKVFLTRHGMSCRCPVPESERLRAERSHRLAAGVVHDGEFIGKWLGVEPDLCPDQGLFPTADELTPVPEPPPTSAVYIGRLEPDTGVRIYIDAVRILTRERHRPFELHVYGDGTLMPALREEVSRDGLPVHFHGRTPDAQKHIVESCFGFIDGRMAIQESMARGRLVLAAYTDPLKRDYVSGESFSPYLVAVSDPAQLANRVSYFIDHPGQRRALVSRAFQYARTLSWERTARAFADLWQQRLTAPRGVVSWPSGVRHAWTFAREARPPARPA